MAVSYSGRFVGTVARSFDEVMGLAQESEKPPTSQTLLERISDFVRELLNRFRNNPMPELQEEFKPLVAQNISSISDWLYFTGVFDPTNPIKEATINTCAKDRLELLHEQATSKVQELDKKCQDLIDQRIKDYNNGNERLKEPLKTTIEQTLFTYVAWTKTRDQLEMLIGNFDPEKKKEWKAKTRLLLALKQKKRQTVSNALAQMQWQLQRNLPKEFEVNAKMTFLNTQIRSLEKRKAALLKVQITKAPKTQLLSHIFQTAFDAPFFPLIKQGAQRDKLIAQFESYKPTSEASLSRKQRLYFTISKPAIDTLTHPFFRLCSIVGLLYKSAQAYQSFGTSLVSLYTWVISSKTFALLAGALPSAQAHQTLGTALVSLCSPVISPATLTLYTAAFHAAVLKCASVATAAFVWIVTHQLLLYSCVLIGVAFLVIVLRDFGIRFDEERYVVFPFIKTLGLPGTSALLITGLLYEFGNWWKNYNIRIRASSDKAERNQALACWHQMTKIVAEQRKAVEARTPPQPITPQ